MWVQTLITVIFMNDIVSIHSAVPNFKLSTRIPSYQRSTNPFSFVTLTSQNHALISKLSLSTSSILHIRGGADVAVESNDEEDNEEDYGEGSNDANEDESEDEEEEKESTVTFGPPIQVQIRTNLNVPIIDQNLEFTASQKRDIASIKLSISRQMRGRPPVSSQRILLGTRVLQDDELIADLLEEWEEEHDMGDDDDDDDESIDKDTILPLILDIPPPIDPKFATELKNQFKSSNVHQLLDAYVYNMAVLHRNTQHIFEQQKLEISSTLEEQNEDDDDDHDDDHDDEEEKEDKVSNDIISSENTFLPESILLRQHAQLLREQLKSTFTEETLQMLEQVENSVIHETKKEENDDDNIIEGGMTQTGIYIGSGLGGINEQKSSMRGGAKMTVKRALQRNLNINWPDTIRNTLLFLFFGHFGAKSQSSRLLMMSMAPLCFLLQFRPIKILIKQLFYAIGKPPGILLSLLPAPQQKIMGLDTGLYMRDIYGEDDENHVSIPEDNEYIDNYDTDLGDDDDDDDYDSDDDYDDEDTY